jgi:hypothetical protein
MRMRLKASQRDESPQRLLEQLRRVQHQSAKTRDGQVVRGITELAAVQHELFTSIGAKPPMPAAVALTQAQQASEASL